MQQLTCLPNKLPVHPSQLQVYGLPAFLMFKNGELVPGCKKEGAVNQKMLAEYIKQYGGDQ